MKRYFITGTDTDCGKTYVTKELMNHYYQSAAIKPIASGCHQVGNEWLNSDVQQLIESTHLKANFINPWCFKTPVSPHIAAAMEDKDIDVLEVANYCQNIQIEGVETLFIEGAGGVMVPLTKDKTWIDFLKITNIPVLLVVGVRLGCINHALLSYLALKTNEIDCVGWIANCISSDMLALEENIETLTHLLDVPYLARVPHGGVIEMKKELF